MQVKAKRGMDDIQPFLPQLREWTELRTATLLYDSLVDGYTTRSLNDKITGHAHVMLIVITTDNCIFGSFNGKRIPTKTEAKVTKTGYFVDCDEDFFVFSLQSPNQHPPEVYVSHKHAESLSIMRNSNPERCLIGTVCAFWLYEDHAFVSKLFHSNYKTLSGHHADNAALTGNCYPTCFAVKQLLAFEWTND